MTDKDSEHGSIAPQESVLYKRIPMREEIKEKIDRAEQESNEVLTAYENQTKSKEIG